MVGVVDGLFGEEMKKFLKSIKERWRLYLPYLYLHIDFWFIEVRTEIWHHRSWTCEREVVALKVRFFKWHIEFELYDTKRRAVDRYVYDTSENPKCKSESFHLKCKSEDIYFQTSQERKENVRSRKEES